MVKIVPDLLEDIANNIYLQNKKEANIYSIYNVLLAKASSSFASKNILTNSLFHIEPCPLAYYGVNFVSSGFSKNTVLTTVNGLFNWLENEYNKKNDEIKTKFTDKMKRRKEYKNKTDEEIIDEFDEKKRILVTEIQKATSSSVYDNAYLIAREGFGSIFFSETEFEMAFNNAKVLKNSYNDIFDMLFNLWDSVVDFVDKSSGKQRTSIKKISTNACFMTSYEKFLKEGALKNVFYDYLENGFARRIFLYVSKYNNPNFEYREEYTIEEVQKAKSEAKEYNKILFNIYKNIPDKQIFVLSKEAEDKVFEIKKELKQYCFDNFSYSNELTMADKILNIDINGASWKIIKLAFIFNFFEGGNKIVSSDCIEMAYNFFLTYHNFLKQFLNRKIKNNFDEYKIFILKNLNKELILNKHLRDGFKIRPNDWKNFKTHVFQDFLDELQDENIYFVESKNGKQNTYTFYRKEN